MKIYQKQSNIHPCKLERNDLFELIRTVKETFPLSKKQGGIKISSNIYDINIRASSIEEFLKHYKLPDIINRLNIELIGWDENSEIDKSVKITFYNNYINLDVNGLDETWVLSKYTQITNFLKKKKPWFCFLYKLFPFITFIVFFEFGNALFNFIIAKEIIFSIITIFFIIVWSIATFYHFKSRFLPYTQIIVTSKVNLFNKDNILFLLVILSLIVSIVGGIIIPFFK